MKYDDILNEFLPEKIASYMNQIACYNSSTMNTNLNTEQICQIGKSVLEIEQNAINKLKNRLNKSFAIACQHLLACKGHVIVIGMGKSGHIANKIAATFASTGTPAFFVHPGEANHGDLGMITENDVVLAISNSGSTTEILAIIPVIKRLNIPLIAMIGNSNSPLAKQSTVTLDISVEKEACPLGLAPTASTTTTLSLGDALAIALLETRGFTAQDFALSHPGGNLGKRLLIKIKDLMRTDNAIPKISSTAFLNNALLEMTAKTMGMTTIVNENGQLEGIFTDGDLRRAIDRNLDFNKTKITEIMTKNCKTITPETLAFDALKLMEEFKITSLVIVNKENNIAGVTHIHDILKTGITA